MRISTYAVWVAGICVLASLAPAARAQQQPADNPGQAPSGPIPAYHSPLAGAADNGDANQSPADVTPDSHSLSGAQALSLGIPLSRTYWQTHFDFEGSADSNPVTNQGSGNTWTGWATITGGVDVHRSEGNNTLALSYLTGGMMAVDGPGGSGIVQELSLVDGIAFRRWNLSFIEQLSYLPPSGVGLNTLGGTAIGGIGGSLNPGFGLGQTLLTTSGQSLSNSSDVEVDRQLTNRTSLTFVAGYSLLHYFDNDLLDYGNLSARAGYNYQLTRRDSLAVSYTYSGFRYSNFDQSIDSHAVQLSYGRRVTGRLAFQASGGPQIASFQQPIANGSTASTGSGTTIGWTANASLNYQLRQGSLSGSYYHGVGGGSGVLAGSISDTASGAYSRQVTRTVNGGILGAFTRSHGTTLGTMSPSATGQTYDYWSAGANLSRAWGRSLNLSLSYQMQYQTSGAGFCVGTTCSTTFLRNVISVGASWRDRPRLF